MIALERSSGLSANLPDPNLLHFTSSSLKPVFFPTHDELEKSILASLQHFDPEKHLAFQPPSKVHSMEEIGMLNRGISPVAVSEPFRLFTEEAVNIMRAEILAEEVQANHTFSSDIAARQLRGYSPRYLAFIKFPHQHQLKLQ
jgi:hypothetical protein